MPPNGELYRRLKAIKDARNSLDDRASSKNKSGSGVPAPGKAVDGQKSVTTKPEGSPNPGTTASREGIKFSPGSRDGYVAASGARAFPGLAEGPEPDDRSSWEECATGVWRRVECLDLDSTLLPPGLRALLDDSAARDLLPGFRSRFHFDTETTGLSGGAGTRIFLLGWSRLLPPDPEKGCGWTLEVRQYFLADFPWEPDYIALVEEDLNRYGPGNPRDTGKLVTYNGASFDLPLCRTRWIMNGRPWPEPDHHDCLHPARRIWKALHASCSLGNLESVILGVERHGDPGGALVPELYFSWLRNPEEPFNAALAGVLSHHRQDLVSLFGLDLALEWVRRQTLDSGTRVLGWVNPHLAILGLPGWTIGIDPAGLWKEFSARNFAGGELCVPGLAREAWDIFRDPWWGKRLGPWLSRDEAFGIYHEIWKSCQDTAALRSCLVHLEHHARQPEAALKLVDEALSGPFATLASRDPGLAANPATTSLIEDLLRRQERLRRKTGAPD